MPLERVEHATREPPHRTGQGQRYKQLRSKAKYDVHPRCALKPGVACAQHARDPHRCTEVRDDRKRSHNDGPGAKSVNRLERGEGRERIAKRWQVAESNEREHARREARHGAACVVARSRCLRWPRAWR